MIELLRKRRSIRKYTTDKIAPDAIEILVEAALRAPSSRGINPWEFIVVDNPELITALSGAKESGSAFLKTAPLAVVVCADSTKSDVWIEDYSIAAIILQLTASSLALGSCWVQIRNRQYNDEKSAENYVQDLFHIPEHIKVGAIIGIGHPAEQKPVRSLEELQYDKIHNNLWA
jgi:nitroreductase